jgi:hypothetical protein
MTDQGTAQGELIRYLQNALAIADELEDRNTGHLIEQALDQARSQKGDPKEHVATLRWDDGRSPFAAAPFVCSIAVTTTGDPAVE